MKRARRSFWTLFVVAALAMGSLSTALTSRPGPATGAAVAASGAVLVVAGVLALRILRHLETTRRTEAVTSGQALTSFAGADVREPK